MKRIYKRWTIKDIEYLRRQYPVYTVNELAEKMGTTYDTIAGLLRRYNITKDGKPKRPIIPRKRSFPQKHWTLKEQEYVRNNYHTKSAYELAAELNCSRYAVYNVAVTLGLKKYNV